MSPAPSEEEPTARLFVALDLPEDVRGGITAWQADELRDPALRPVPAEALHLTLCFLGHLPEREVPRMGGLVAAVAPRAVELMLRAEPVTRGRPPSLYALEAPSEAAVELQAELSASLAQAGLYEPEQRPFWPHVTVARVRRQGGGRPRPQRVKDPPGPLPGDLLQPFEAVRIALYRSNLRSHGARYVSLTRLELPPAGAGSAKKR